MTELTKVCTAKKDTLKCEKKKCMRKQNHFVNSDRYINMCRAAVLLRSRRREYSRSPKTHTLVRFTLVHTKEPQLYMRMRNISLNTFCLRQNKDILYVYNCCRAATHHELYINYTKANETKEK